MLTDITVKNFKCFGGLHLKLAPLTLLTGFNGGGKSTSIQPLLLLAQATKRASNIALPLNGQMVTLGTAGDVVSAMGDPEFELTSDEDTVRWVVEPKQGERAFSIASAESSHGAWQGALWPTEIHRAHSTGLRKSLSSLAYISAVRAGTPAVFPFPETDNVAAGDVGESGQFAPYWYDRKVDDPVPPLRWHPGEPGNTVRKQVDAYLSSLFPNAQANVTAIREASALALRFKIGSSSEWRRPANTGFGLTYAFPILVALLTAESGTLVIDSPEAHLHPSVQSEMGRMLARVANSKLQLIIETHSDHLLNGVRLAVKEGLIPPEWVAIHFFSGATQDSHGVVALRLDRAGNISDWPRGFFDQTESDLARLSNWG